jgi:predicted transcriptional regulator
MKSTNHATLRLPPHLHQRIQRYAERQNVTPSAAMRLALTRGLAALEADAAPARVSVPQALEKAGEDLRHTLVELQRLLHGEGAAPPVQPAIIPPPASPPATTSPSAPPRRRVLSPGVR